MKNALGPGSVFGRVDESGAIGACRCLAARGAEEEHAEREYQERDRGLQADETDHLEGAKAGLTKRTSQPRALLENRRHERR